MMQGLRHRRFGWLLDTGDQYLKSAGEKLFSRRRGFRDEGGERALRRATNDGPCLRYLGGLGKWPLYGSSPLLLQPLSAREFPQAGASNRSLLGRGESFAKPFFNEAFRPPSWRAISGSSSPRPARLEGKVAMVTGGASGIGEATVRAFVDNGARTVIADIQDGPGQELAEELGGDAVARYIRCDVTDEAQLAAALDRTAEAFGGLDVLHNNAGILGALGPLETISADQWDFTFQILVRSYFLGIKHAKRIMTARGVGGSIINTASEASVLAGLGPHCYTVCKHAVIGLTKTAAAELREHKVRVNAISPGRVFTPLFYKAMRHLYGNIPEAYATPDDRKGEGGEGRTMATLEDIAAAAVFFASDESKFVSGQNLVVDGSFTVATKKPPSVQAAIFGGPGMVGTSDKSKDSGM